MSYLSASDALLQRQLGRPHISCVRFFYTLVGKIAVVAVERTTAGSELARLDKAIDDQNMRIQFAKEEINEDTEKGGGDLLTSA